MHHGYFEGILQLRNPNKEVVEFINKKIKENGKVQITKEEDEKDGVNLYFTSRRFLQNLAKKLHKQFGGELKMSPKLFSRNKQTSRDIFRLNVLYRFPKIKKGQTIEYNGDNYKVLIVDKKVQLKEIKTNKKIWVEFRKLNV